MIFLDKKEYQGLTNKIVSQRAIIRNIIIAAGISYCFLVASQATLYIYLKQEIADRETIIENKDAEITDMKGVLFHVFGEEFAMEKVRMETVNISSYSSEPRQTDSSPYHTSNGEHVGPWSAAVSQDLPIPIGKTILIEGGGTVTRNDTMPKSAKKAMDLWCPNRKSAEAFGRIPQATIMWLE